MNRLYTFDFDGTLTRRDSFIEFLLFAKGWKEVLKAFALHTHLLLAMKLHLMDSGKVKESIFARCFKGTTEERFNELCLSFADKKKGIMRKKGLDMLQTLSTQPDTTVMVVTASVTNWVAPFFAQWPAYEIVGTRIETRDGRLTGRFLSANCRRREKVRRILALHPDRRSYYMVAYGDSSGDIEMLNLADEGYYNHFK